MKKLLCCIAVLLCLGAMFAQTTPKPTVVVVPFDSKGIPEDEAEVLFEVFQSEFANLGKAKVVDRSSLDKIKKQQEFQTSDWSNTEKIAELGKALNASMVVTGQIMSFKSKLVTTIKIIDVNTTEIVSSVVEKTSSTDELFDKLASMAGELGSKLNSPKNITKKDYKVGDEGPGGGVVFYVDAKGFNVYDGKGNVEVCHYLEVSKQTLGVMKWCDCKNGCSIQTGEGLGWGKSNTYKIVNYHSKTDLSSCAAITCYSFSTAQTKKGDWFLPSKDELNLLYKTLKELVLSDARTDRFWSSTLSFSDSLVDYQKHPICQEFSLVYLNDLHERFDLSSVRAVRAFTN